MICQCVAHILSLPCQIGEKGTMIACPPKLVFHSKQAVLWMTCHPHPPCEHLWGGLYLIPGDQGIPGKNRYILLSYSLSFLMNTCKVAYFLLGFPGRKGKNAQRADYTFFHPKHSSWVCDRHIKVWHILFHPPSQTPMVAYFLSGPPGKNDYVCTTLTTHVFSYVCALTHFPPLLPMTTCGSAYFLPGRDGKNTQRIRYTYYHPKHTLWVCETFFSLSSLINTCGWPISYQVIQVFQVRKHEDLKCSCSENSISYLREFGTSYTSTLIVALAPMSYPMDAHHGCLHCCLKRVIGAAQTLISAANRAHLSLPAALHTGKLSSDCHRLESSWEKACSAVHDRNTFCCDGTPWISPFPALLAYHCVGGEFHVCVLAVGTLVCTAHCSRLTDANSLSWNGRPSM